MLRLADTNKDGRISLQEFMTTLQRQNVSIKADEILYIYEFIDKDGDGKLDYRELSDVLRGIKTIDATAYITEKRKKEGKDHGYTPSEMANIQNGSKQVSFDKDEIRSAGTVSGMSTIMRRTDAESRQVPPLTDEGEHRRNIEEIKKTLLAKAFSFEDVLARMAVPKPGNFSKVTFNDFSRVVLHFCGSSRFSSYQIKFAFKENCQNLANANQ